MSAEAVVVSTVVVIMAAVATATSAFRSVLVAIPLLLIRFQHAGRHLNQSLR
ncbi:hypothetical protein SMD11_6171 [Streptomyces albireticuli]|uniref:Uncharacterized protein n=1 Tax=Streptomyces albireticuli TaxID=1940 RepID=A0A1Z2LBS4_9ACTN|nr:hypothetical protein SMD11_6171 [Streptomyces albireticuli]